MISSSNKGMVVYDASNLYIIRFAYRFNTLKHSSKVTLKGKDLEK